MSEGVRRRKETTVVFGDMATLSKEKIDNPAEAKVDRYVGLEHLDPGSLKIKRWGNTTDVESSKLLFKSGDIIFGKRRAYQRKLAVADFDGICSAHAMVLRAKPEVVLKEFLPFFMQSDEFMDRAVEISVGGLSPTINWSALAKEEFHIPPLEEQRRIIEVLKSIEASLRLNHTTQKLLRQIEAGTVDHWVESLRGQGLSSVTLSELTLCKPSYGVNAPAVKFRETLPRFLRITDIDEDGNLSTENLVSVEVDDVERYRIKSGDLLLARTGTVGRAYLASGKEGNTVYAGYLVRFSLDSELVDSRYVFAFTRSSHYWRWVSGTSREGVQANINAKEFGKMPIWLPNERTDQQVLVKRVEAIREMKRAVDDRLAKLISVKKAVVQLVLQGGIEQ